MNKNKSIFFNWQTLFLVFIYFGIRLLSFALASHTILQAIVVFVILMILGGLYYKHPDWAWYILLGELVLGGAGHFFEFFGLSIRTILVLTFIALWTGYTISTNTKKILHIPHKLFYLLITLASFVGISALIGTMNNHGIRAVIQDLIPYSFFVLVLPAYYLFKKQKNQKYLIRLLIAFLISSAIFSLITFILFSSGAEVLQSPYYKWFRDVAMGKITDMGGGFFRIVAPEHLLITPLVLLISSLLMKKEKHHKLWWAMLIFGIFILILNFSRIYFLALIIGLIVLKYKHNFKNWIFVSATVGVITLLLFTSTSLAASGGASTGLDLLGLRIASISRPETEASALTRMTLLEPIFMMIRQHPITGSGLGSRIIFIDPVKSATLSSPHFDWGYLELWVELGLFGLTSFLSVIFYCIFLLIKKIRAVSNYHDFYVGLLAGCVSFLVMNITSPALFHVLGIFYFVFVITIAIKPHTLLEDIVKILYKIFHRNII